MEGGAREVRAANSARYWKDTVAVEAFRGREDKIAALIDYACNVTEAYLATCVANENQMTFENLRRSYLDPTGNPAVPIPIDDVMIATFALAYLDIAHRVLGWLKSLELDWHSLGVLVTGPSGRPSSGLTWSTNNACYLLWKASKEHLNPSDVFVTPHGPTVSVSEIEAGGRATETERQIRELYMALQAGIEMSRLMFAEYPAPARRDVQLDRKSVV